MFNFNRSNNEKNNDNRDTNEIKSGWLDFAALRKKDKTFNSIADGVKFAKEDLKLRSMVIEMLEQEFGQKIKDIKNYDYLIDMTVDRLKRKQLEAETGRMEM